MPGSGFVWSSIIILAVIGVIAYLFYSIHRARRTHRARSEERAAAMMIALHQHVAPSQVASAPAAAPPSRAASDLAAAANTPAKLVRRPRFLTDTQRLLYLVLRSAMPDYTLMANVRIVDLLDGTTDASSVDRSPRLRELLHARIDFIVCSTDLVPIAALVIYDAGITAVPDESAKVDVLRELGIKFMRFRADRLPRPSEVRGIVLG